MQIFVTLLTLMTLLASSEIQPKFNFLVSKSDAKAYPFPGMSVKKMNEQQLQATLAYAKEREDSELAFKCFYHLINVSQDHNNIKSYKLDLADYCYSLKDYTKAATRYEEFCMLYPGSDQSEYAQYQLILCTFYISLAPDKDQSDTLKTINLISLFLQHAKKDLLIQETKNILQTCRFRLLEHEVVVLETYLKQHKFVGAQHRIDYIKKEFTDVKNIEQYVVYLQAMLELVQDVKSRPFVFYLKLEDALKTSEEKQAAAATKRLKAKAVSFFVA